MHSSIVEHTDVFDVQESFFSSARSATYRCLTHITRDTPRFRLVSTGLDGVLSALYFTTKFCLLVLYTILHDPILETIPNAVARTHQAS